MILQKLQVNCNQNEVTVPLTKQTKLAKPAKRHSRLFDPSKYLGNAVGEFLDTQRSESSSANLF